MTMHDTGSIPTRQSLLERLKDWENHDDWRAFFDTYWRLIHATALRAGLGEAEAQEVVQDVMIAAARKLPEFRYRPGKDSLKGWLLGVTRWKVADQWRKRGRNLPPSGGRPDGAHAGESPTGTAGGGEAPEEPGWERIWEAEWRENLLQAALERLRTQVPPAHYEIYHLHVLDGMGAGETARTLGVSLASVYLAKLRVGRRLREELRRLEAEG